MSTTKTAKRKGSFAHWLLATSSLVAFSAAISVGTTTPAHALGCDVFNSGTTSGLTVANTTVFGICNEGTLSSTGIVVTNSTVNGFEDGISDSGIISAGGISVDANSTINVSSSCASAIAVSGPTFVGGIKFAGTINVGTTTGPTTSECCANAVAIQATNVTSFSGGITNTGIVNTTAEVINFLCNGSRAMAAGINVSGVSTFSGGIANKGTLNVTASAETIDPSNGSASATAYGINVQFVSNFSGGISNGGAVNASATATVDAGLNGSPETEGCALAIGVNVSNVLTFSGGISNSGLISATATSNYAISACAPFIPNAAAYGINVSNLTSFSGGITNSGILSATATALVPATITPAPCLGATAIAAGINVNGVSTFTGGINNTGSIIAAATATTDLAPPGICSCAQASATAYGINVQFGLNFTGGITNGNAISVTATASGAAPGCGCASATAAGINVSNFATFSGGIINSGLINATASVTITAAYDNGHANPVGTALAYGINVSNVGVFNNGITNSGTINATATVTVTNGLCTIANASAYGINVSNVTNFSGGITNTSTGVITAVATAHGCGYANAYGIAVTGPADNSPSFDTFLGGIVNNGKITATATAPLFACGNSNNNTHANAYGIYVNNLTSFGGGILNTGSITARTYVGSGPNCVHGLARGISVTNVSTFSGDINNQGSITAIGGSTTGIYIDFVSSFSGQIINGGSITADGTGIYIGSSVLGPGISIFTNGTISGFCDAAIQFNNTGHSTPNTLTLGPGFVMNGNVEAVNGDIFQLGGTNPIVHGNIVNGQFDLSGIGTQYTNFGTFNTVSAVWTVFNQASSATANTWNVTGGTMLVDGDLSLWNSVIVSGAGTLGGAGDGSTTGLLPNTIVQSGGTLMPGDLGVPGGLLTIKGTLDLQNGSIYLATGAPGTTSLGTASLANVTGTTTIENGAKLAITGQGAFTQGVTYEVLTATGGFSGGSTFSNTNNVALGHMGSMLGDIEYGGTNACPAGSNVCVVLTPASLASFLPPGASTNQNNVANGITGANTGTPPLAFQNLFNLPPSQLQSALTQLSGEVATSTQESGIQLMNQFIALLSPSGLATLGGGSMGSAPGFAPEQELFTPEVAEAYAGAMPTKAGPLVAQPRYNMWTAGYGGTTSIDGDPTGLGTHTTRDDAAGTAVGIDFRTDPTTVVGVALGGAGTQADVTDSLGHARTDAFQAGIYGSRQYGAAYLSGVASFANYWATTDRTINVMGTDQYHASFDAQSLGGRLEGGYHVATMPVGVTPYAAVQAQYFHLPSYAESVVSGSSAFADSFASKDQTVVRTELGSWFDKIVPFVNNAAQLKVFARAAWAHDFNNEPSLTATFLGLPSASFVVNGARPAADLALATAGWEYKMRSGFSVSTRFDGEFGKGTQTYTGTGVLKYQW